MNLYHSSNCYIITFQVSKDITNYKKKHIIPSFILQWQDGRVISSAFLRHRPFDGARIEFESGSNPGPVKLFFCYIIVKGLEEGCLFAITYYLLSNNICIVVDSIRLNNSILMTFSSIGAYYQN